VLKEPDRCPADPDQIAEAYCMGTLDRAVTAAFEDHFVTCNRCAEIVEATERYVRAMKVAARRLRPAPAAGGDT
jgi:hypothetical protein